MTRMTAGDILDPRQWVDVHGRAVPIPDPERLVHLQFRRFAGCPICHRHLRSFVLRHDELYAAGIREVVVFHSTAESVLEFQAGLPFTAIADPDKSLYADFGVEASVRSVLHPATWPAAVHGMVMQRGLRGAVGKGEAHLGLPADFLVSTDGRVLACAYGTHANDQWSVDQLLALARVKR